MHSDHAGNFFFDEHVVAPGAAEETYLAWLYQYIELKKIGLFIPTSEAEIDLLTKSSIRKFAGAQILIANDDAVSKSLDKNYCMSFLRDQGVQVPKHGIVGDSTPLIFPVIVKPQFGRGSKQIQRFDNIEEFSAQATPGNVWQEYLSPDNQEYTCPIYNSVGRGTNVIVIRRSLSGGQTSRGEVVSNRFIEEYVITIAKKLKLQGSINIQLRLTASGPYLFEINPRLSSTLVFRDKIGFSDLRWWIQDTIGSECCPSIKSYNPPKSGTRFYRGAQEYIHSA
jgi:carbamoyl-phosphate synthase large subunit